MRARMCGITTSLAEMWLYSARKWCSVTHTYFQFERSPASAMRVVDERSPLEGVVAPIEVVRHPATDEESELHGGMIADLTPRQGTQPRERCGPHSAEQLDAAGDVAVGRQRAGDAVHAPAQHIGQSLPHLVRVAPDDEAMIWLRVASSIVSMSRPRSPRNVRMSA